jgi:translation initiation factor IF-1
MRKIRRIFWGLVILVAIGFGLGLYLGWFSFSTRRDTENNMYVCSLEVHKGKISGDTEAAKDKAKQLGVPVDTAKKTKGTLVKAEENDRFTVQTEDHKEMVFQVPPSSKARVKDLRPGDNVTVAYKVEDDKNIAQTITVEWGL